MHIVITADQQRLAERARALAQTEIKARAAEVDATESYPWDNRDETAGLRGISEAEITFEDMDLPPEALELPPRGLRKGIADLADPDMQMSRTSKTQSDPTKKKHHEVGIPCERASFSSIGSSDRMSSSMVTNRIESSMPK